MSLVIRAFPLHRPVDELLEFAAALNGERRADAQSFYRRYRVSHESWHLQETAQGPWVIVVTHGDQPDTTAPQLAEASEEFDAWFKDKVRSLSGVDLDTMPLGPPTMPVFAWSDGDRPGSDLCA